MDKYTSTHLIDTYALSLPSHPPYSQYCPRIHYIPPTCPPSIHLWGDLDLCLLLCGLRDLPLFPGDLCLYSHVINSHVTHDHTHKLPGLVSPRARGRGVLPLATTVRGGASGTISRGSGYIPIIREKLYMYNMFCFGTYKLILVIDHTHLLRLLDLVSLTLLTFLSLLSSFLEGGGESNEAKPRPLSCIS